MPYQQAENEAMLKVSIVNIRWENVMICPKSYDWRQSCHLNEHGNCKHVPILKLGVPAWTKASTYKEANEKNFDLLSL
jgi:hypothetical protein